MPYKYPKIGLYNVIGKGYRNNIFKRKVAESFLIKDVRLPQAQDAN